MFQTVIRRIGLLVVGLACAALLAGGVQAGGKKIRVMIIDGQNNHNWKATTPVMKKALEDSGRFTVTVATSPEKVQAPKKPKDDAPAAEKEKYEVARQEYEKKLVAYKGAMAKFRPDISNVDVVLSNYNGEPWSKEFQDDLEKALKSGKVHLVIVHAANNAFANWVEYNLMIGMGWRGASYGKRLKVDDDGQKVVVPPGEDLGSGHRYTGPFQITVRDGSHPITKGMPQEWMHYNDELYDNMRGPIENVHLLATAHSDKAKKGTGTHEPMIWTVSYGKGRVFHTPMGHDVNAMTCVGFVVTLQRGTEWAATGNVTIPIPENFPTADKTSTVKK